MIKIKHFGVDSVQFVLSGSRQEFVDLLATVSTKRANELVNSMILVREFISTITTTEVEDFTNMPETIDYISGHSVKFTQQEFLKAKRKYELHKPVTTKDVMTEDCFNVCKASLKIKSVSISTNINYNNLTPNQMEWLSNFLTKLETYFNFFKFNDLTEYIADDDDGTRILNFRISNTHGLLQYYKQVESRDTQLQTKILVQTERALNNIAKRNSGTNLKLMEALESIMIKTSKQDGLNSLIDSPVKLQPIEFIEVLALLRHSGLYGLDIHTDAHSANIARIQDSKGIARETNEQHLQLLARNISSLLNNGKET